MNINKGILFAAIAHYGADAQLDQCMEECLELALAIRRHKRNPSTETLVNIIDELADVNIMIAQAAIIVQTIDETQVQGRVDFKLQRLTSRMDL